jgi:hypothetical protein
MWPRRDFDIPILGIDAVAVHDTIKFFIADASPVSADRALPPILSDAAAMLSAQFTSGLPRADVPDWGKPVFSDNVLMLRPEVPLDVELAAMYAGTLTRALLLYAKRCEALDAVKDAARVRAIDAAHRRCAASSSAPLPSVALYALAACSHAWSLTSLALDACAVLSCCSCLRAFLLAARHSRHSSLRAAAVPQLWCASRTWAALSQLYALQVLRGAAEQ